MKNDVINLGVSGLGRAFSLMMPTFRLDRRVKLTAAFSPRRESRDQFERDFSATTYDNVEELVEDPSVDAIYIASPHQFHAEQTVVAAEAGKHVLVEKPMALSLDECDTMIEACARNSVYLIVGHSHSFDIPYLRTRQLIHSGEFGNVRMIQALNYTDFLYRPRRPEELSTEAGGGAVFNQAAHQLDIVRLLAGSPATRIRAALGSWDPERPTEGAYTALLWFENGAVASMTYSGYAHFDSDEWCGWVGEMGILKDPDVYGAARKRLQAIASGAEEARLKRERNYGGAGYQSVPGSGSETSANLYQHFGPVIVSCERADLRPLPDAVMVYGDFERTRHELEPPPLPRMEVIDELYAALAYGRQPLHDGIWAMATMEACIGLLESGKTGGDIPLRRQA